MKSTTHSTRLRKLRALSPLALLLLAPAAGAHQREQVGDQQRPQVETGQASQEVGVSNRAGVPTGLGNEPRLISNLPPRQVKPDPKREQQLTGRVLEKKGEKLYVEGSRGEVVSFDVSALQFRKQPQEGQQVRVTYQVEDGTDNVAVGLAGAVRPETQQK